MSTYWPIHQKHLKPCSFLHTCEADKRTRSGLRHRDGTMPLTLHKQMLMWSRLTELQWSARGSQT